MASCNTIDDKTNECKDSISEVKKSILINCIKEKDIIESSCRSNIYETNILEELFILNKKKKKFVGENEAWDVISNISKYSSDNHKETEKKKLLLCFGNNNFGQLGLEDNVSIGLIDFSTIMINKCKRLSFYDNYNKKFKKSTDKSSVVKNKKKNSNSNNSKKKSMCSSLSTNKRHSRISLSNNELYNEILTKLPSNFALKTIRKKKKLTNGDDKNNTNEHDNKNNTNDDDNKNNTNEDDNKNNTNEDDNKK